LGFLLYLKNSGAIYSEHLKPYTDSGGDTYVINNIGSRMIYMPRFGTNFALPRFLTNGNFKSFDTISNKTKTTWCDRWLLHNFIDKSTLLPESVQVYKPIIEALVKENILVEKDVKESLVWGLNPEKLFITTETEQFRCSHCKHILSIGAKHAKHLLGMKCMRKECSGEYTAYHSEDNYYKLLYTYGDLQRIVAREHTGLLERNDRETVETNFIKRKADEAWKPNLLSATPTLEMGINIGDLSSVILCSVPPNGANYLQRIGRAGRSDGND
jgi:DEAD/DEAH box helicase domain-containing protein